MGFRILQILMIVTLVLGIATVILTGIGYSKPFYSESETEILVDDYVELRNSEACVQLKVKLQEEIAKLNKTAIKNGTLEALRKFKKESEKKEKEVYESSTCSVQKHVVEDELMFSIIVSILISTIVVFFLTLIVFKNPKVQITSDVFFYIFAGLILIIVAIPWFMSVYKRTYDYEASAKLRNELQEKGLKCAENKNCRWTVEIEKQKEQQSFIKANHNYGVPNLIHLNLVKQRKKDLAEALKRCEKHQQSVSREWCKKETEKSFDVHDDDYKAEGTFALVLIAGTLMVINALLYFGIAVLVIINNKSKQGQQVLQSKPDAAEFNPPPGEGENVEQSELELEHEPEPEYPQPGEGSQEQILEQ